MTSKQTFARVSEVLRAVYFRTPIGDDTWLAYFLALADVNDDDLLRAVAEHIAHSDDFPTVAQLRRLALAGHYPVAGNAWAEVTGQMQQAGRYREPQFTHQLIGAAVDRLGGWGMLCASENLSTDRAHFLRIYEELVRRENEGRISFQLVEVTPGIPLPRLSFTVRSASEQPRTGE